MPIISPTAISPHRIGKKFDWSSYWTTRTPSGLTVEALTDTSVRVDWVANGVEDYDGYSIERSLDGVNYSEVDTVTVGTETLTDTVTADTYYYYRVRAYKSINYSDYSNIAELEYGPELVGNVTFDSDTWWSNGSGVTIADGVAHFNNVPYGSGLSRSPVLVNGTVYKFEFTILNYVQGRIAIGSLSSESFSANGTYIREGASIATGLYFSSNSSSPVATCDIDNVSVKKKIFAMTIKDINGVFIKDNNNFYINDNG